ncbi:glycine zipper family protein [Mesobacterium pallidum]|uniref:glycine zipper family protein n=1 Tax=Mesobacterium pallidum TaxID=2872037 RepID=UPI001EE2A0C2|nr:glycine zipper family protein [Mesobacterium pallidum]
MTIFDLMAPLKPFRLFSTGMIAASGLLAGCADSGANYTPILDGAPTAQFQADLGDCQALARNQRQFDQETAAAAVLGAGAGALLGEFDDGDALGGAIFGALAGGAAAGVDASERRQSIVKECLRGRGHAVVG